MHIWLARSLLLLLGFSLAAVSRLLAVTPLVVESRLRLHSSWASVLMAPGSGHRLHSWGARIWLPCGIWDPPGPGIEPVSPALAGRFFTTEPPGKP